MNEKPIKKRTKRGNAIHVSRVLRKAWTQKQKEKRKKRKRKWSSLKRRNNDDYQHEYTQCMWGEDMTIWLNKQLK